MSAPRLKMSKFRLKIDMSELYDDERNLAYILVDPRWEQVLCLEEHVEEIFGVPKVRFLTDDGIYIPSRETIEIIRNSDVLRVIIPQQINKTKRKNKSNDLSDEAVADESMEAHGEKRKYNVERLTCSTPNDQPSKKLRTSEVQAELNMHIQQCSMSSDTVTSTNNRSSLEEKPAEQETIVRPPEDNEETAMTRKRKRNRKKKQQDEPVEKKSTRLSSVPVPISSSTLRLSRSMRTPNRSFKHVHFDGQNSDPKKEQVAFRCPLSMDMKSREIEAEEAEESAPTRKKPTILIHENRRLVQAKDLFIEPDEQNDISVIEIDDSLMRPEPSPNISIDKILPLAEPLLGLPAVGEIVLFKMYRLNEASCPVVSDYICGRCEDVDSVKRTMSCLVLDGLQQIDDIPPRFTLGDGDKATPNERANCIVLSLDELLDKKIFKMS